MGVVAAFSVLTLLSAYLRLHDVAWIDGMAFAGGLAVVMAAAALAAYDPARRATRVNPTDALRADV
jgi:ABC-type antimicrobial peptide transport system permease subunit